MKKDLNELSRTGILSRYISKARTQANSPGTSTRTALKRERGIDLARKKKWGGIEDMPGKPAKVVGTSMKKEEAEQIDELSVDALERYKRKAGEQMKQNTDATATHDRVAKPGKEKVVAKRIAGRSLATHKQVQQMYKQMNKEEHGIEEAQSHQAKTTLKHIINPTKGEIEASKSMHKGTRGFRDRIALLKSAEARGALKKEDVSMKSFNQFIAGLLSKELSNVLQRLLLLLVSRFQKHCMNTSLNINALLEVRLFKPKTRRQQITRDHKKPLNIKETC